MKPALLLVPLLACCASLPVQQPLSIVGDWGGPHVGLHLSESGGTLDYDCAHGTIGRMLVGPDGRFTAEGTHTAEHGGPVRVGEVLPKSRATYDGVVRGNRMTLHGRLETGAELGPFELRRGAQPQLYRCL